MATIQNTVDIKLRENLPRIVTTNLPGNITVPWGQIPVGTGKAADNATVGATFTEATKLAGIADNATVGATFTEATKLAGIADNATVGATIGTNVDGQITSDNVTTFIAESAIPSARIISLSSDKITTGTLAATTSITVGSADSSQVKIGSLDASKFGISGRAIKNLVATEVFRLDKDGLTSKITQSSLNLFGASYHDPVVAEGSYVFSVAGTGILATIVSIPVQLASSGMYKITAHVTGYFESTYTASGSTQAFFRETSMCVYYDARTGHATSMVGFTEHSDTSENTNTVPANKIILQLNASLLPELKLLSRNGYAGTNSTTTYSYIVRAYDNAAYPFKVY